ncbi:L domain-like protein [Piromyces finnis]|uniref:L domain-like protein n=1 Tax=Piromyces finnis TaxID=1754191 RepID=A0A1Y1UCU4_9FUNG|nr:L domain-like protein [Piromyces finnis]|eukprot:ORX34885.1 L domain-like protein [Piromyces finnis]
MDIKLKFMGNRKIKFIYAQTNVNKECEGVNKLLNKDPSFDCCTHGDILCSNDGHITRICIPSELGNLTNLTYLSIKGENLRGSIPPELGNLTNLEYLYLHGKYINGTIPSELGNLSNMQEMYFSRNYLTGPIPSSFWKIIEFKNIFNNSTIYVLLIEKSNRSKFY